MGHISYAELENLKNKADHEILALAIKAPRAFELIVDRYHEPFVRKITALLKNQDEAEDVVQDTFVKIYTKAASFTPQEGASFKSWAYRILLNTCFTHCKKMKRHEQFVSNLDSEMLELFSDTHEERERVLDMDFFFSAVHNIPRAAGRLLKLGVLEGKTHEDMATELGVSTGAVRTRIHRARQEFRRVAESL